MKHWKLQWHYLVLPICLWICNGWSNNYIPSLKHILSKVDHVEGVIICWSSKLLILHDFPLILFSWEQIPWDSLCATASLAAVQVFVYWTCWLLTSSGYFCNFITFTITIITISHTFQIQYKIVLKIFKIFDHFLKQVRQWHGGNKNTVDFHNSDWLQIMKVS